MKLKAFELSPDGSFRVAPAIMATGGFKSKAVPYVDTGLVVLVQSEMSAMDIIKAMDGVMKICKELLFTVYGACGMCDNCLSACRYKKYTGGPMIHVDAEALREAEIGAHEKLCCYGDKEHRAVHVVPSAHRYDLSDIPGQVLELMSAMDICKAELNDLLMEDTIIYEEN